jgi:PPOX class probable F420-dependent enzyme
MPAPSNERRESEMLEPEVQRIATQANFAVLTTRNQDGSAQSSVMWIDATADHLLVNTETGRAKDRNVQRDPAVTVLVWESENPYHYIEVRGRVINRTVGDVARRHLDELAHKYLGTDYQELVVQARVLWTIEPGRQFVRKPPSGGHGDEIQT